MLISIAVIPVGAVDISGRSKVPVVAISGDSEALYMPDGTRIMTWKDLVNSNDDDDGVDVSNIIKSVANVIAPFVLEGLLHDKWDNYYEALQNEVSELFGNLLLDNNGEASDGSGLSEERKEYMRRDLSTDKRDWAGTYGADDYHFYYDWRLDPWYIADQFNDYIKAVKKVTGADKVGIMAKCLGTSVTMAYIAKYGTDDICGVAVDGSVVGGIEILGEAISGGFTVDVAAINRILTDCDSLGIFSVEPLITATLDVLSTSGAVDFVIDSVTRTKVYCKILEGATSALALSSLFTHPCYWACVCSENLPEAMRYVFGEEGSQKRVKYAGLIEKIENYDENVRQKLPELWKKIDDNANLCIISKYGFQMIPTGTSRNKLGDLFSSVEKSSFGATTSDIFGTLSDEYIKNAIAAGNGKYISPDKQIDASTCLYPDNTWFVKNVKHSNWTWFEDDIMMTVISADRQLTVDDISLSQFMVFDNEKYQMSPMTEENCNTYNWVAKTRPESKKDRALEFVKSLLKLLKLVGEKLFSKPETTT